MRDIEVPESIRKSGSARVKIRARIPRSQKIEITRKTSRRSRKNDRIRSTKNIRSTPEKNIAIDKKIAQRIFCFFWRSRIASASNQSLYDPYFSSIYALSSLSCIMMTILYGGASVYPISDIFDLTMLSGRVSPNHG